MAQRIGQWLGAHRAGLVAAAIIGIAAALRVALLSLGWPGTDSDDATMSLMALHILQRGEHPIFFYGQSYMGSLEAYVGALMFALLGVSSFAMKCGLVALYAAFMGIMYALLRQLFSSRWALAGLGLLAFGTDDTLYHQLEAYGGYLETLIFGALLILSAVWLARTLGAVPTGRRVAGYAGWGLAAGLGIWSDPLVAPFVGLSALLLALTCWQELRGRVGTVALVTLVAGISPWLVYVLVANPHAALSFLQNAASSHQTNAGTPWPQQIARQVVGTLAVSVPNNTGANALIPVTLAQAWPPEAWGVAGVTGWMALRIVWGAGFLILLAGAFGYEARRWLRLWRKGQVAWSALDRAVLARRGGRLLALGAPGLTVILFALSSSAALGPWQYARYLISLLIAMPVMLGSLWEAAGHARLARAWRGQVARGSVAAVAGLLAVGVVAGALATFAEVPAQQRQDAQQQALVTWLVDHGETRIYADYWTCLRVTFQSDERVICSVVGGDFAHLPNRYPPYDAMVRAAPEPAYVFPLSISEAGNFPGFAATQGWGVTREEVPGAPYVVYQIVVRG